MGLKKRSAGILLYRKNAGKLEVLLVHPGGPFWTKKDINAWSIPKGEIEETDDLRTWAYREFKEETGHDVPQGEATALGPIKQASGKEVWAWAIEGEIDADNITSNTFPMAWPPRSGKTEQFPEVDRAEWFDLTTACIKIHPGQEKLLRELAEHLDEPFDPPEGITEQISLL